MSNVRAQAVVVLLLTVVPARAQSPTGIIAGTVTDASGAVVAAARVHVTHIATQQGRVVSTSTEGQYAADLLQPGTYLITVTGTQFKRLERTVAVESGTTTTVDVTLAIGDVNETMVIEGVVPRLHQDHHQISAVVRREQIDALPLNGRNFLELAKLEPGVVNPARGGDNRTFVSFLGSGLPTIPRIGYSRVTVDGANIGTPGTVGVLFQVSQEVVQEFQIATVNFDQAMSLSSNGVINIVTRSGGNDYQGSAFAFYRDHHLAAYPGLRRDSANPDPFFRRAQFGADTGGPIRADRAFFFASYERHDQRGVVSVQPQTPEFARLGGLFPTPYVGDQFSARTDVRLHANHTAFGRYTHDSNRLFSGGTLPSAWQRRSNRVGQGMTALTSVLSPRLVSDARFSYMFFETVQRPPTTEDCANCFGLGSSPISISGAGVSIGDPDTFSFGGRRYQFTESLVWETGRHRVRVGFDWERATNTVNNDTQDARLVLWSPAAARRDPTIPLPASFTTVDAILQLPLQSVTFNVGSGGTSWRNFDTHRLADLFRLFVGDTWRIGGRVTVNSGVSWSYEPNALNHDLTKPALLAPILGADNLDPPSARLDNLAPTIGFTWTATRDSKTVVRGGAGRYFDPAVSTNFNSLAAERDVLGPLGTGRISVAGSAIQCGGVTPDFRQRPTTFTGAQLLDILPACRAELLRSRSPGNRDFTYRNLDSTKTGQSLYDPSYRTPYAIHLGAGIQRELTSSTVVSADVVWKRFVHTYINGIDYNHWNSARGPVLPACGEAKNDITAICSNGFMYFDTTIGRARYAGLLVRADHRVASRAQVLVSYALGSYVGTNGTGVGTTEAPGGRALGFNNDDWFENYGPLPTDRRHVLNVSGFVELPWRLQAAFNLAAYSPTPFAPFVADMDFNGDGSVGDLHTRQFRQSVRPLARQRRPQATGRAIQPGVRGPADARWPDRPPPDAARGLCLRRWFLHAGPSHQPSVPPRPAAGTIHRVHRHLQSLQHGEPRGIQRQPRKLFVRAAYRTLRANLRLRRTTCLPIGGEAEFLVALLPVEPQSDVGWLARDVVGARERIA